MTTEKRINRRVPLNVYLNKFINGVPFMARAKDISPDGIYLAQLLEPSADEARVGVQFQLPGSKEVIYAEGEIVRDARRGKVPGNGVRFTLITDYHRRLIERYVARGPAHA
ncbi:MAG TPA: PilZ domain-containing protein [Myxococcales bacterium]|jgi:hypothetical protein